ncbi:uncharacterized protein [Diadema antillarum]|uniref:uncharacterized protein n=1 Tax=Diadema antillarum TaxID=105358 RepID=UPI003A84E5CF
MSSNKSGSEGANTARVILWCVPRAISTALTKCLSAIQDMDVHLEPFVYCYIAARTYKGSCGEDLPMTYEGNEEAVEKAADLVGAETHTRLDPKRLAYASIKKELESATGKYVFVKDMGVGMGSGHTFQYLPSGFKHTFLIRHPVRCINSGRKATFALFSQLGLLQGEAANEETYDIERDDKYFPPGCYFKELYDVWKYVRENIDNDPVVIDADDLLAKPGEVLKAYCAAVGFPYSESLLQWDASTESLRSWKAAGDNVVLDLVSFYGTAMKSSKFLPPSKFPDRLTPDVIRCSKKVMKYYEEMYNSRIKV